MSCDSSSARFRAACLAAYGYRPAERAGIAPAGRATFPVARTSPCAAAQQGQLGGEQTRGRPNNPNRSGLRKATILAIPVLVSPGSVTLRTVTALIYYRLFVAGDQPSLELADRAGAAAAAAAYASVFTRFPP
jgi:hypothetical protein